MYLCHFCTFKFLCVSIYSSRFYKEIELIGCVFLDPGRGRLAYCKELSPEIMEADRSHDLQPVSCRFRRDNVIPAQRVIGSKFKKSQCFCSSSRAI